MTAEFLVGLSKHMACKKYLRSIIQILVYQLQCLLLPVLVTHQQPSTRFKNGAWPPTIR